MVCIQVWAHKNVAHSDIGTQEKMMCIQVWVHRDKWCAYMCEVLNRTEVPVNRTCLPFIRSGQNHPARHNRRGKKTRQTEEEVGRQHQGMDRPGVHQVPDGSGEQEKMAETGCEIICGAPTTLALKG